MLRPTQDRSLGKGLERRGASGQQRRALMQRMTLAEQIEAHLRDLILTNELGPGQDIPSSADLANEYGVSRTIMREAMKSLQAKGLIEVKNGRRARVRPITSGVLADFFERFTSPQREATLELLELRRGIEVEAIGLATQRRTEEDLEALWKHAASMKETLGDPDRFLDVDLDIHLAIATASKNRVLFHLVDSIRTSLRNSMREGLMRYKSNEDWERTQHTHLELIQSIADQQKERAIACMTAHFDAAIESITKR